MTYDEMVDFVNNELPISLHKSSDLVEKVYERYPILTKPQIAMIIMSFFYSFRELLIKGKIISLLPLLSKTNLLFFTWTRKDRGSVICAKIRTNTHKFKNKIYIHGKDPVK